MENKNKKIELLQKLQKLSRQGVGGEKVNAEKMLNSLMKKYNISDFELNNETVGEFDYRFADRFERELFEWICYSVSGDYHKLYKYVHQKNKGVIECSKADFIEIQAKFDFFKRKLKEEMKIFVQAFAVKNNLYIAPENKRKDEDDQAEREEAKEEVKERLERVEKLMRLASALDKHDFLKQIGGGFND